MREIRLALLEADVNLAVVKEFTAAVKERALGDEVHEEPDARPAGREDRPRRARPDHGLDATRGSPSRRRPPTVILLVGLQGSGKTTTAAKLALMLRKEGKKPLLVAADLQRPAAIAQLEQLGKQIQIPVASSERENAVDAAMRGVEQARSQGCDVVIVDTAGRLQVDEELMDELERIHEQVRRTMCCSSSTR